MISAKRWRSGYSVLREQQGQRNQSTTLQQGGRLLELALSQVFLMWTLSKPDFCGVISALVFPNVVQNFKYAFLFSS